MFLVVSGKDLIAILNGSVKRVKKFVVLEDIKELLNVIVFTGIQNQQEFFAIELKKINKKNFNNKDIKSIFDSHQKCNVVFAQKYDILKNEIVLEKTTFENEELNELIDIINLKKELFNTFKFN